MAIWALAALWLAFWPISQTSMFFGLICVFALGAAVPIISRWPEVTWQGSALTALAVALYVLLGFGLGRLLRAWTRKP